MGQDFFDIQYSCLSRFFGCNNQISCIESEMLASFSEGGEGGSGGRDGDPGVGESGGGDDSGGGSGIRGGGRGAFLYISSPS